MRSLKKITLTVFAFFFIFTLDAQKKASWPEMHDFHEVMSKTFHPAEEGNLQPTRDNAVTLLAKATAWKASAVPAGYKADETKKVLAELETKCDEINKGAIAKKSDAELLKLITDAHDIFHQIMEKCRVPEDKK